MLSKNILIISFRPLIVSSKQVFLKMRSVAYIGVARRVDCLTSGYRLSTTLISDMDQARHEQTKTEVRAPTRRARYGYCACGAAQRQDGRLLPCSEPLQDAAQSEVQQQSRRLCEE